jgi:hypothetical protein
MKTLSKLIAALLVALAMAHSKGADAPNNAPTLQAILVIKDGWIKVYGGENNAHLGSMKTAQIAALIDRPLPKSLNDYRHVVLAAAAGFLTRTGEGETHRALGTMVAPGTRVVTGAQPGTAENPITMIRDRGKGFFIGNDKLAAGTYQAQIFMFDVKDIHTSR